MSRCHFIPLILLLVVLTACQPALSDLPAETFTPNASAVSVFTPTASPTIEPITFTPPPTPTPTPVVLPVTNGTPIPDLAYEVITAENIGSLRQIARYGYPRLLDVNPYRLTADGQTLVVGTTEGLEFYDAQTQEKSGGFDVEFLRSFDMTSDGQYILTLAGDTLTVWTRDGQAVRSFDGLEIGYTWGLNPVALSPDGALLAVQRVNTDWQEADKVDVYRVADGALLDTVRGNGVVFSADFLATVFDGSVRLYPVAELGQGWETRLPKQTLPWCGASEGVTCGLAFSPDGTLAAILRPARVDVYLVADRRLVRQVSGWETDRYSPPPQVQFGGEQMLVVTSPIYDASGIKVKPLAIVVDIASGEWLNESEMQDGFAYLAGGQVQQKSWKAEGEMPYFWRPKASVEGGSLLSRDYLGAEYIACTNQECIRKPMNEKILGWDGKFYTLTRSTTTKRWEIRSEEGQELASFQSPEGAALEVNIFPNVVVVEVANGRNSRAFAYRADGKRAEISRNFVYRILTDADNKMVVFGIYQEGLKILDVEQWVVKRYEADSFDVLALVDGLMFVASWETGAVQVVDTSKNQSQYITVPGWRAGVWGESIEASVFQQTLLMIDSAGVVYVIDTDEKKFIHEFNSGYPYSNTAMTFSPDGRFFVTYGADGFIRVWAVPEKIP